jgi:hypothetical protein
MCVGRTLHFNAIKLKAKRCQAPPARSTEIHSTVLWSSKQRFGLNLMALTLCVGMHVWTRPANLLMIQCIRACIPTQSAHRYTQIQKQLLGLNIIMDKTLK